MTDGSNPVTVRDIDVPFSHTWGESADTVLPEIAALPILQAEFEKRENWLALPPAGTQLSVSLRKIEATEELVLHPLGQLRISQRAVPLMKDEHVLGVLNVEAEIKAGLDENDVNLLNALAGSIAVAVDNARLHTEVKRMAMTDVVSGLAAVHVVAAVLAPVGPVPRSARERGRFLDPS